MSMDSGPAVVDGHVHLASGDLCRYPRNQQFANAPTFTATLEEFRSTAGPLGVSQAVLVQPSLYGSDHRYLVDCLEAHPGEYVGVALVDPIDTGAPGRLTELVQRAPVTGIRLALNLDDRRGWLEDDGEPLCDKAADLGVVLSLLVRPAHLPRVEMWLDRRRELCVVIDHLGRPDLFDGPPSEALAGLLRLARYPRVHIKVSALPELSRQPFPHKDTWRWAQEAFEAFGAERSMWGSDFPFIVPGRPYADALAVIGESFPALSDYERDRLLGGTAREVYRLPAPKAF
jgi:L-fuconolactonase